ncbi:MAG: alpha-ribazole phosphatase family protein [Gammaproteobacteria bacterium]|jgi:alpha-ribazole phosphatase
MSAIRPATDSTPAVTRIDIIRHGQPVGGRRYRGQLDDPLSELGWQQMWNSVGDYGGWDVIVTSPLLRCSEFAQALGERLGIPVTADARLKEVGFGAWEGRSRADVQTADPEQYAAFYRDPVGCRPPGAEPLPAFTARVAAAFDELVERYRGQSVLVVAHAGVIRATLAHTLQIPLAALYRIQVANAGVTRVQVPQDGPAALVFHGGTLV